MRYLYHIFISLFIFSHQLVLAEENPHSQLDTALVLCISELKESGFVAAKAALETYKTDAEAVLILKEAMCHCSVSEELHTEIFDVANDVIRESKDSLSIGIAWYQKSRVSYCKDDYKNALIYSEIALHSLKKAEIWQKSDDSSVSHKELFEVLCHIVRRNTYEKLDNQDKYEAEKEILKSYEWFSN